MDLSGSALEQAYPRFREKIAKKMRKSIESAENWG